MGVLSKIDPENELTMLGWVLLLPSGAPDPKRSFPGHQGASLHQKGVCDIPRAPGFQDLGSWIPRQLL